MSEKLKKLIKPMIAAAVVITVLAIAYFSGSDVSVSDKPESRAEEITTVTTASATTASTAAPQSATITSAAVTTVTSISSETTVSKAEETKASRTRTASASVSETTTTATSAASAVAATVTTESVALPPVTTVPEVTETQSHDQCSISISCSTVFDNKDKIDPAILAEQPSDGVIVPAVKVSIGEGDTVFDVLKQICDERSIPIEYSRIAATNNYYIEGINNLYEFDAGNLSGWMYSVNGKFPQLSSSQYTVSDGDVIEFVYSCSIGVDVGDDYYTKAG